MNKAAFFDRDGTINVNYGHVYQTGKLDFIPGIPEIIKQYNERSIPVIVITNQAGIAKGYYTEDDMHCFNNHMANVLRKQYGANIDAVYFCPHHPEFTGECDCRKPKPGMILKAALDYNIDLSGSVFYGDKESDRLAASRAGIKTFICVDEARSYIHETNVFQYLDIAPDAK
jgi:D-glycero-D-manno-heptose 1,7-bisphosphate phosphatase